jgi:hypothetical protein
MLPPGPGFPRPRRLTLLAACLALLVAGAVPSRGLAQAAGAGAAVPGATMQAYRGFLPGVAYREFAARAAALAADDPLVCNTSRRTAQLMECGLLIRDPSDTATFYVSAYVLEGHVAMVSLGDSGGPALVERVSRELAARYGRGARTGTSSTEWTYGRKVVRFNWRGRGDQRWVYITLEDRDVTDRISRYVRRGR